MKTISFLIVLLFIGFSAFSQEKTLFDFTVKDIDGKEISLSQFKGKKILVVNVASKCGLTKQYKELEAIYEKYGKEKFTIVAFPANNFLSQEPENEAKIKEFCSVNFHVTFPMMSKISVKGNDIAPIYQWLTKKSLNGKLDSEVKWNFQKYLIDEQGKLVDMVLPKEKPDCQKITDWIEGK